MLLRLLLALTALAVVEAAQVTALENGKSCGNAGVTTCNDGFFVETVTAGGTYKTCTSCAGTPLGKTCTAASTHTACFTGDYLNGATCTDCGAAAAACTSATAHTTCATGYYKGTGDTTCSKCNGAGGVDANAATCNADDTVATCNAGFFKAGDGSCTACSTVHAKCLECTANDIATCTKFTINYYLNTAGDAINVCGGAITQTTGNADCSGYAIAGADTGFINGCKGNGAFVAATGDCSTHMRACPTGALECAGGGTATAITSVAKCVDGKYIDGTTCADCATATGCANHDAAATCVTGGKQFCNAALATYYVNAGVVATCKPTDACVVATLLRETEVKTNGADLHADGIQTCTGATLGKAVDVMCESGYYQEAGHKTYRIDDMEDGEWVGYRAGLPRCIPLVAKDVRRYKIQQEAGDSTCNNGYFYCGDECFPCKKGCKFCNGDGYCDTKDLGYFLSDVNVATACKAGCKTCTTATDCSACFDGYFLDGTACTKCSAGCGACSSSTSCTTCNGGYSRKSDGASCKSCEAIIGFTDGVAQYPTAATDCGGTPMAAFETKYQACHPSCSACSDAAASTGADDECTACDTAAGKILGGSKCWTRPFGALTVDESGKTTACQDGYYAEGSTPTMTCKACRKDALTCESAVIDSTCKFGTWLDSDVAAGPTCTSCTLPKNADRPTITCQVDANCALAPCNDGNSSTISDRCGGCSDSCTGYECYNQTNCVKSIGCITNTSHPLFSYTGGARDCEIARNGSWVENQIVKNCTEDPNCASSDRTARCAGGHFKCVTPATGFYTNTDGKVLECYSGTPGEDSCGDAASCDDIECDDDDWMTGDEGVLGATDRCEYTVNGTMCTSDVIRCEVPKNIEHLKQITNALFNGKALDLVNGTQIAHDKEVTISCKAGFTASIASFKLKCNATAETIFLQWGIPSVAAEAAAALPKCNANPPPCCDESAASSFGPVLLLLAVAAVFAA